MAAFEIPDGFTVDIFPNKDSMLVQIRLWGQTVYSQRYPFSNENGAKTQAAIEDTKRDFVRKFRRALAAGDLIG